MATTTNYSWTTPDDTALVKDGAAAIRSLGTAIDTTTKNLNPSTTAGDIEYRSSTTNVNTRLPIGTANQVLRVNSGATAPEWATVSSGGMTLLSTTTLSGTATDVTSISQDYNELVIWVYGVTNNTANGVHFAIPLNSTTILDVFGVRSEEYNSAYIANTNGWRSGGSYRVSSDVGNDTVKLRTDANNFWQIRLPNYTSTTTYKGYEVTGGFVNANSGKVGWQNLGVVDSNSAVDGFRFQNTGGTFSAGTIKVYGVK
jgi:hypothetical protein